MFLGHDAVRLAANRAVPRSLLVSIVAVLSGPGAIGQWRQKLTVALTDFVLRFTSQTDTLFAWGVLSEGYIWFSAGGLQILTAGHDPILRELGALVGPGFVSSAPRPGDFPERLDSTTADEAPTLTQRPDTPLELLVEPGAPAETIWVEARIPLNAKPYPVNLLRGVGGRIDSVAVEFVKRHIYRPAMIGKHPVHAWIRLGVPVPAGRE